MKCPNCGTPFQFFPGQTHCVQCGRTLAEISEPTLPTRETILADPSASFWLKGALRSSEQRDIVDSMGDADLLFEILKREADEVASQQRSKR